MVSSWPYVRVSVTACLCSWRAISETTPARSPITNHFCANACYSLLLSLLLLLLLHPGCSNKISLCTYCEYTKYGHYEISGYFFCFVLFSGTSIGKSHEWCIHYYLICCSPASEIHGPSQGTKCRPYFQMLRQILIVFPPRLL